MRRYAGVAIWIVLITWVSLIFQGFYLQYYPFKTVVITQPVSILSKRVQVGNTLTYQISYCRYYKGTSTVSRYLKSATDTITYAPVVSPYAPGCGTTKIGLVIPPNANPGTYHMEASADFIISSTRTISVPFKSEDFEIYK